MTAALHHAMADGHRALAQTFERWPFLGEMVVYSGVLARSEGRTTLLRAELQITRCPESLGGVTQDEPRRCPWAPELLEVDLDTGAVLLWPGRPRDLGQLIAGEVAARRALTSALRQHHAGGVDDSAIDWLVDVSQRLSPGPLSDLVERTALEACRPSGLSDLTVRQLSDLVGMLRAA